LLLYINFLWISIPFWYCTKISLIRILKSNILHKQILFRYMYYTCVIDKYAICWILCVYKAFIIHQNIHLENKGGIKHDGEKEIMECVRILKYNILKFFIIFFVGSEYSLYHKLMQTCSYFLQIGFYLVEKSLKNE
jgi:hypothetical protein